jgi:hypothetical protein
MAIQEVEAVVASIAHALNAAQIPCVLWGQCLLQVHGVPTVVGVRMNPLKNYQTLTNDI